MKACFTFNGPIITAIYLLKKRWTGIPQHIFLQHLEEMGNVADIHEETHVDKFPQAFWLHCTRENLENGDLETEYLPWDSESKRFITAMSQYSETYRLPSMLDEIIFKLSAVEAYEQNNPWLRHRLVDPDKAWAKRLSLPQGSTIIESLGQELAETKEDLAEAQRIKRIRKRRIKNLEEQLAEADEGLSGVDATRWKNSVATALSLIVDIFQGKYEEARKKQTWKKTEFETEFAEQCEDYHTTVLALAWKFLPEKFKQSRGRPKENQKNLTT